ncbi:MAG: ArsC family transcriptional regulator [Clostridia bacterium]|nr:ArsC family transcriptional regulator [Clostridia bacterium]
MNIQIFGTGKCFDSKKAQRFFKERRIPFQWIDLREKPMSPGELRSVLRALGSVENALDPNAKDQDALALVQYISPAQKEEKLLENQHLLKTPIVRNGSKATAGYAPDEWKKWIEAP